MEIKSENNVNVSYPSTSTWLYEEITTLINFVKSKAFMYDKKDPDYNKNHKKNSTWERISEILRNKSPKECKRKWSTLRIQQRRILLQNIMKKRKSVQWQFYESLQFLIPHMETSAATDSTMQGNISDEDEDEDENESSSCIDMDNDTKNFPLCQMNNSPSDTHNHDPLCHGTNDNNQIIISYQSEQPHCAPSEQSRTMRPSDNVNTSVVISSADTFSNPSENQSYHFSKSDTNSLSLNYFLMDVQMQMNKMNDFAQMELKIDIQKLILEKLRKPENLKNE